MKVKAKIKTLPYQREYSKNIEPFYFFIGGFGTGKSDGDVYRALELGRYRRELGQKPLVAIVAPTYGILADTTIIDFHEILEKYNIRYKYNKTSMKSHLIVDLLIH